MKKLFDLLFVVLKVFSASCLAAMVIMVFGNVVLRYAFNSGITVSEELSSWGLTWMTYTAGLIALREHGHLGFDALLTKFPAWLQRVLLAIAYMLMIGIMWLFLDGSWQQTQINLGNVAPASGISMGALYGVGVVFSVIAILILLGDLYDIVTGRAVLALKSEAAEALAEAQRHRLDENR